MNDPASLVEQVFEKARRIEPPVAPRRLSARDEIFDAADHGIIIGVRLFIAVSAERRNIHLVVHQRGISQPRPDHPKTGVQKIVGRLRRNARGKIRTGHVAVLHGLQNAVTQFVHFAFARKTRAADADVHHVVAVLIGARFVDLHEHVFQKFHSLPARERAALYVAFIKGEQILVHSAQRHRRAPLHQKTDVAHPYELQRLFKRFGRVVCKFTAVARNAFQPIAEIALAALQRFRFRGVGKQEIFKTFERFLHRREVGRFRRVVRVRRFRNFDLSEHARDAVANDAPVIGRKMICVVPERALAETVRDRTGVTKFRFTFFAP